VRCHGAADTADRMHVRLFAQARTGPPKRRSPALAGTSNRAKFVVSSTQTDTIAALAAQRACCAAARRAASLQRRAQVADAIGLTDASLRFAAIAEQIRAVLI
jgi:hypothetical protein